MLDPDTVRCGKCMKGLQIISTTESLSSRLRKQRSMFYAMQRRDELDALVGNVYDKKQLSIKLYSVDKRAHKTLDYWTGGFCKYTQGIAISYGETELMRIRFQELRESSPELYRYWMNKEIES
jgi:hypothetical protein